MGNYESLVSELQKKLGDLAPLLIEATALRTRDLMIESIAGVAGGGEAKPGEAKPAKVVSQRKAKKKRAYTRIDDGSIMALLREKGPMRLMDVHQVVGGSMSNLSKKVALLKTSGVVQDVVLDGEKRIKATRDGRGRATALRGEKVGKATKTLGAKASRGSSPESTITEKSSTAANENAA